MFIKFVLQKFGNASKHPSCTRIQQQSPKYEAVKAKWEAIHKLLIFILEIVINKEDPKYLSLYQWVFEDKCDFIFKYFA